MMYVCRYIQVSMLPVDPFPAQTKPLSSCVPTGSITAAESVWPTHLSHETMFVKRNRDYEDGQPDPDYGN